MGTSHAWRWIGSVGLLLASACSGGGSNATAGSTRAEEPATSAARKGGTVTVRLTNPFSSYNVGTADDSGTWNQEVVNAVQPAVAKFDDHSNTIIDPNLVTVSKTSDQPLIVQYAFNPAAVWDDGQPVGCDDLYLAWVANNGVTTTVDDTGSAVSMFQTVSTTGWDQVSSVMCSPDGHDVTFTYSTPFSDWKALVGGLVPAHVVAAHAGLTSAAGIRTAYEAHDEAALKRIADFWNTGFKTDKGVDPTIDLSAGPYRIESFEPDQSVTLVRNERYWGPSPLLDRVVFRVISDGAAQVQALANREVQVIAVGGAQPDAVAQLHGLSGVTAEVSGSNAYEHFDFNFQVPLFRDKAVRQAVADCMPRQEILDKLIVPTDAHAVLQQNRIFFPTDAAYVDTSGGRYDLVDIPAAKAALVADGWTLDGSTFQKGGQPLQFKLLHNASRSTEAELIEASCAKAGIAVVDDLDAKWSSRLGAGQFDAVVFTWVNTPTLSSVVSIYETPPGPNALQSNYGSYSNPAVDALMHTLATATDPAQLTAAANQADTLLWDDLATIPLWRYPEVVAYSDDVHGVVHNPTSQGLTWNVETWSTS